MALKCNDCGTENYDPSRRSDLCVDCFQLRGAFLNAINGRPDRDVVLAKGQKMMRGRSHRAAAYMKSIVEEAR